MPHSKLNPMRKMKPKAVWKKGRCLTRRGPKGHYCNKRNKKGTQVQQSLFAQPRWYVKLVLPTVQHILLLLLRLVVEHTSTYIHASTILSCVLPLVAVFFVYSLIVPQPHLYMGFTKSCLKCTEMHRKGQKRRHLHLVRQMTFSWPNVCVHASGVLFLFHK